MKKWSRYVVTGLFGSVALIGFLSAAQALPVNMSGEVNPAIIAGNEDDSFNGAPIVPAGRFTGVVSINIRYDGLSFICTGSVIGERHVITAGHCVDTDGLGHVIDISNPDNDVRVVFNDGGAINQITTASAVTLHPDYSGFGNCGPGESSGFFGQCLNDDIAVLTLEADIPAGVEIYGFATGSNPVDSGTLMTMVGHGVSGDGYYGEYLPPSFNTKRFGFNFAEFFDCDDEATPDGDASGGWESSTTCGLLGNAAEVWYADFDGYDSFLDLITGDGDIDTFCLFFGVGCGNGLGDDLNSSGLFEAAIGGGDSGGPSFIYDYTNNKWLLAGNNTFGTAGLGPFGIPGAFGEIFGGNLYRPYLNWIDYNFVAVPEPATLGLLGLGLMMFGASRRRRKS